MASDSTASGRATRAEAPPGAPPGSILVVDVGGKRVKILATGRTEPRKASSKGLTPARLVETVRDLARGWRYDAISIGYPGLVGPQGPRPRCCAPSWPTTS